MNPPHIGVRIYYCKGVEKILNGCPSFRPSSCRHKISQNLLLSENLEYVNVTAEVTSCPCFRPGFCCRLSPYLRILHLRD